MKRIATLCEFVGVALSLFTILFLTDSWTTSASFAGAVAREIQAGIYDPKMQWAAIVCLVVYLGTFWALEWRNSIPKARGCYDGSAVFDIWRALSNLWLPLLVILLLYWCPFAYQRASGFTDVIAFLAIIVYGKGAVTWNWRIRRFSEGCRNIQWLLGILVCLLAGAALWHTDSGNAIRYHGTSRWSGPWNSPNKYGILMGVGLVLAVSQMFQYLMSKWKKRRHLVWTALWLAVTIICGIGLFKSYSRGAWLATVCGLIYVKWRFNMGSIADSRKAWLYKNWISFAVVGVAFIVLFFWQFRFSEWLPARRVFSVCNVNDFSWRNRVFAWEGAMQMMADRPWFGYGWDEAEVVYKKKYSPPNLENGAAIQMNDYLMLGISAGMPALACLLMYVGLSLKSPRLRIQSVHSVSDSKPAVTHHQPSAICSPSYSWDELVWLQTTCRAGAIVFLVGFFFDGGLFKIATGSVFWTLLELGRADVIVRNAENQISNVNQIYLKEEDLQRHAPPHPRKQWKIWFRRAAWLLGIVAFTETVVLISTPFFHLNNATLIISRNYLVPSSAVADLNLLATNVDWSNRKLRPLLQHASLSNYNRQIINWKLDDQIYRDYVLNPLIAPERDGQLKWRRWLWEYFYPPVRQEITPASAAEIVMKFLRRRTTIVEKGPVTIEDMWQHKQADATGIETLAVAAFRSVGIPARLNNQGLAEFFSDGEWRSPL